MTFSESDQKINELEKVSHFLTENMAEFLVLFLLHFEQVYCASLKVVENKQWYPKADQSYLSK